MKKLTDDPRRSYRTDTGAMQSPYPGSRNWPRR